MNRTILLFVLILSGCTTVRLPERIKDNCREIDNIDSKLIDNLQILLSSAKQHSGNKEIVDCSLKYTFEIIGEPTNEEKKRAKNITKQEIIEIGKQSESEINRKRKLMNNVRIDYKNLSNKYYNMQIESRAISILKNILSMAGVAMLLIVIVKKVIKF